MVQTWASKYHAIIITGLVDVVHVECEHMVLLSCTTCVTRVCMICMHSCIHVYDDGSLRVMQ